MANQPQNLNIDSLLSKSDMDKLIELLGQNSVSLGGGNSNKKNTMTTQAKNYLLNQLSSHQKIQEVQKPFKDMNEEEKKSHREELKARLHDKQNMFKQKRINHSFVQKSMDAKNKKTSDNTKITSEDKEHDEQQIQTETQVQIDNVDKIQQTTFTEVPTLAENLEDFVN